MKKLVVFLGTLLLGGSVSFAQTTVVSGNTIDTDGTAWVGGSITAQFVPNPSQPNINVYNINGVALNPAVTTQGPITLGANGSFSLTVYTSSAVSPAGSQWQFTICPLATSRCGILLVPAVGNTQNITAAITAVMPAPRFPAVVGNYGYADAEAILQLVPGSIYYNVTNSCYRGYSGSAWGCVTSNSLTVPITITNGGTGATTAAGALANLGGAPLTGTGTSGTWPISITGNAAMATNVTGTVAIGQGGTGSDTAAGANLNITGVTQTGTLGTSSQVSTFPGTVAVGTPILPSSGGTGSNGVLYTVQFPSDFLSPGVSFYRDLADNYTTSFTPANYVASWGTMNGTYYVDFTSGSDTNNGLTPSTAFQTAQKAYVTIQALSAGNYTITIVTHGANVWVDRVATGIYEGLAAICPLVQAFTGQRIYITPDNTNYLIYATTAQSGLSWSLSSGMTYTYQTARTTTTNVMDNSQLDAEKIPLSYTYESSIATVEANAGSWWTDSTNVYVHTTAGTAPTSSILVGLGIPPFSVQLANSAEFFLQNIYFVGGSYTNPTNVTGDYTNTKFTVWNGAFSDNNPYETAASTYNGLSVDSVMTTQIYNSIFSHNGADGFNVHATRIGTTNPRLYSAGCFNCSSHDNGLYESISQQNAYTAHEGINMWVIGSKGYNTNGPIYAMVNCVYFVGIGDTAWGEVANGTNEGQGSYSDVSDGCNAGYPSLVGKMYLDDSKSSNGSLFDIAGDGSPITLRDFTGTTYQPGTWGTNVTWLPSVKTSASVSAASGVYNGYGNPNGVQNGFIGEEYQQRDGTAGNTNWVKNTGIGTNTGWVELPIAGLSNAISGDGNKLSGSTALTVTGIQGVPVSSTLPTTTNSVLTYNGVNYAPAPPTPVSTLVWSSSGPLSAATTQYTGSTGLSTAATTGYALVVNRAGTVGNCTGRIPATESSTSYYTVTLYKNGSACTPTLLFNSATQVYSDNTNTCSVAQGDYLVWQSVPTNSPTSQQIVVSCTF